MQIALKYFALAMLGVFFLPTARGDDDMNAFLRLLQTPPTGFQVNAPAIASVAQWEKDRETHRKNWLDFLGPMATVRRSGESYPAPQYEVIEEIEQEHFIRKKIRYSCEPGETTQAFLLIPKNVTEPRPGVVVFHTTAKESYFQGAGLPEVSEKSFGLHLANKGYVVLCPQNHIWPSNDEPQLAYREEGAKFLTRNPENRGMARMLLDGQMAVDLLTSLPEVDAKRIGCIGHSLGAKVALYVAAFDERVVCSVSSEGGIGIEQSNWEADWYLGPKVKEPDFPLSHRELVAMIAPRAFLLLGGDASDGDASWPYIVAGLRAYRLYEDTARIGLYNHHKGHAVPPEAEQVIYRWFEMFLMGK